jgi:Tfp pilus tip-associated adhesin PilY1
MLGGASTQPVIVEAPREIPPGVTADLSWQTFLNDPTVQQRPRVIYLMSGGFLHAIHGGERVDSARPISVPGLSTRLKFSYRDDPASTDAGRELFRYYLRSSETVENYTLNDVVPQPVTTGQLVAREVHLRGSGAPRERYATVLALAQGKEGRGLATLDVTDPRHPRLLAEWLLPVGASASNEPMIYDFPPVQGEPLPVVVVTGGLGGPAKLFAFDVRTGGQVSAIDLPDVVPSPRSSFPTEPVCLNLRGVGPVTTCYALSQAGGLVRVELSDQGAFSRATLIYSAAGDDRAFLTRPVGFFGADGAMNLAFGSGLSTALAARDSMNNAFYKVVDDSGRQARSRPGSTTRVCAVGGAPSEGIIPLGGERVVSPPVVVQGALSFTTFSPGSSGCAAGTAKLYSMNYQTCVDAFDPLQRQAPVGRGIGDGIPASPVVLRERGVILTQTSAAPGIARSISGASLRGGDRKALRPVYWRPYRSAR